MVGHRVLSYCPTDFFAICFPHCFKRGLYILPDTVLHVRLVAETRKFVAEALTVLVAPNYLHITEQPKLLLVAVHASGVYLLCLA